MKSSRIALVLVLTPAIFTLANACATIAEIGEKTCGNAIVEPGEHEDCDGFAARGMECGKAGDALQCRFLCDPAAEVPVCADQGFGCGMDGVCRAPSSHFDVKSRIDTGALMVALRDFDGDGVLDVFSADGDLSAVHYLNNDFTLGATTSAGFDLTEVDWVPAQVSDDTIADLAFFSDAGIGVLRGTSARTLAPTTYPTIPIPGAKSALAFSLDGLGPNSPDAEHPAGEEAMTIATIPGDATVALLVDVTTPTASESSNIVASGMVGGVAFPPVWDPTTQERNMGEAGTGKLDPALPCDQFVLPFKNPSVVVIGTPCKADGKVNGAHFNVSASRILPIPLDLPADFVPNNAFVFDEDGDGNLDVVVTPEVADGGAATNALVAHGPFAFDTTEQIDQLAALTAPWAPLVVEPTERVFAMADLNGDGQRDFVTSFGIYVSQPAAVPCRAGEDPRLHDGGTFVHCNALEDAHDDPHLAAAMTDLNGDGRLDVAFSSDTSEIDIFYGTDRGDFTQITLNTDAVPAVLVSGDFDGDGFGDLAFADRTCEPTDTECDEGDVLEMVFGSPSIGGDPPIMLGTLPIIEQLIHARLHDPDAEDFVDGADELGVMSSLRSTAESGKLSYSILYGDAERQLGAPFRVIFPPGGMGLADVPFSARALVTGDFVEANQDDTAFSPMEGHDDLAMIGKHGDDARVIILPSIGEAELNLDYVTRDARLYAPIELPPDWNIDSAATLAVDLDGDKVSEIVHVGTDGKDPGIFIARVTTEEGVAQLEVLPRISTEDHVFNVPRTPGAFPNVPPALRLSRPETITADIDADGHPDIVSFAYDLEGDPPPKNQRVVVYFHTGAEDSARAFTDDSGNGPPPRKAAFPTAEATDHFSRALVAINLDDDADLEILVVGPFTDPDTGVAAGAYYLDLARDDAHDLILGDDGQPQLSAHAIAEIVPGALSLAVGDIDRDGLQDLAVGYEGRIDLLASRADNP